MTISARCLSLLLALAAAGCGDAPDDSADLTIDGVPVDRIAPPPPPDRTAGAGAPDAASVAAARISPLETHLARLSSSQADIAAQDIADRTAILSSDAFAALPPGAPGGRSPTEWAAYEMGRIGLVPAFGDSFFQPVATDGPANLRNVAGVIPSAARPEETVVYMAPLDPADPAGLAAMLEIAERFAAGEDRFGRTVLFLAAAGAQGGMAGAEAFAADPPGPLAETVGVINTGELAPLGLAREMIVIGSGASELEDELRPILQADRRAIAPDPDPAAGDYDRAGHVAFARRGPPALAVRSGRDLTEGGREAGAAALADYRAWAETDAPLAEADLDFAGLEADARVLYQLGANLADSDRWPNWYRDNAFRAARDEQLPDHLRQETGPGAQEPVTTR